MTHAPMRYSKSSTSSLALCTYRESEIFQSGLRRQANLNHLGLDMAGMVTMADMVKTHKSTDTITKNHENHGISNQLLQSTRN